jgi:hypothetical protein
MAQAATITVNSTDYGDLLNSAWKGGYTPYNGVHYTDPANTAYLWNLTFGYGDAGYYNIAVPHTANIIDYYNMQPLTASLAAGQQFVVDKVSFSMKTTEGIRYTGPSEIRAIGTDWIPGTSDAVLATWNDIMPSLDSGVLATSGYHTNSTIAFSSASGSLENEFSEWMNGKEPNYGFAILATAPSNNPSSLDGYTLSPVTITYHIETTTTPEPSALLLMSAGIVFVGWRKWKKR